MKQVFNVAVISVIWAFYGLFGVAFGSGIGDVSVYLNGGEDVAYIGEVNTLEIWIANDALLAGMSIGFKITYETALSWEMGYGSRPPVNEHGRAIGCWNLGGLNHMHDFDNVSPDHILMGGASMPGYGLPAGPSELCYTLQFYIPSWVSATTNGIIVAPYFYPPAGYWRFNDGGGSYPPDFNGNPVGSETNPVAPPATFDVVDREVCGDVNCDDKVNISDAVYIVNYVFKGGPAPCADCP